MSKKEIKKLTLTELMKNKEKYQVEADKKEQLYIERFGASITIRKPERSLCIEATEMAYDAERQDISDVHMVYNIVVEPNLKDPELQKEFGCVEPYDIVDKLFETGEIGKISGAAMDLAGFSSSVQRVAEVKN
ncbi:phage tail assembly chaperone [Bacillus sp. FJAT-45350]|uniref:phage tail assembly chaperone n=1 Tax=Bacillus sp. FJAT-45350 TaxID=2011014 RepID=UPI001C547ADE|nr:hypothetical protein [Bacillus sp. FJAT-45350]